MLGYICKIKVKSCTAGTRGRRRVWPSDALPVIALRPTGLKRPGVRLGEAIPENVTFWDDSLGRKKGAKGRGRGAVHCAARGSPCGGWHSSPPATPRSWARAA